MALFLESGLEVGIGVAVEGGILGLAAAFLYRALAGRFLIPRRETIAAHHVGVITHASRPVRVAVAGTCWIRPGEKLTLVDVRPRRLQIEGIEVFSLDRAVLRVSVSGEYKIADAALFLQASGNAGDAVHFELRKIANMQARELPSGALLASPSLLTGRVRAKLDDAVRPLGLAITDLQFWEVYQAGRPAAPAFPSEPGGDVLVH